MLISIITACHPDKTDYLNECADSIKRARKDLGAFGMEIDWCLSFDGAEPDKLDKKVALEADSIISRLSHKGVSETRNNAVNFATGEWIVPLDADDVLHSDFLDFCLYLGEAEKEWVGGNRLLMTGEKTPYWNDSMKTILVHQLADEWFEKLPFHPNSIAIKRDALVAVGGWPIMKYNEDLALAILLNEKHSGVVTNFVVNKYRVWEKQAVQSSNYVDVKNEMFDHITSVVNKTRERNGIRRFIERPVAGDSVGIKRRV